MPIVLYIKANPKSDQDSRTFRISESFINTYREINPGDQIITRDLYQENIRPLTGEDIHTMFSQEDDRTVQLPVFRYADEFKKADKIVIAAPMWNLSFPAILKVYLDYVMAVGITFHYTDQGPVGLCQGKKAVHIVTRGGVYSEGPASQYEMGDRYLRTLFGFLGIKDFTTITAEMLDVIGVDREGVLARTIKQAEEKARYF